MPLLWSMHRFFLIAVKPSLDGTWTLDPSREQLSQSELCTWRRDRQWRVCTCVDWDERRTFFLFLFFVTSHLLFIDSQVKLFVRRTFVVVVFFQRFELIAHKLWKLADDHTIIHCIFILSRINFCWTPSLPRPVKFPVWKMHTYTPPNSIFDGPITNLLSILSIFHSSKAVWESRWPSWAVRPNEPSGFRGRKAILNRASALVTTCP